MRSNILFPKLRQVKTSKIDNQLIYKGVVGKALDSIPMDAEKRVKLQRTNAVVGNTATGRSIAILAGVSIPPLMLVGFFWGLFSASKIKPVETNKQNTLDATTFTDNAPQEDLVALIDNSPTDSRPSNAKSESNSLAPASTASDRTFAQHVPTVKFWLPEGAASH